MERIGLFIGTDRGLAVLSRLIAARRKITSVLILVQQKHEFNNITEKIIDLCNKKKIPYMTTDTIKPRAYAVYLQKAKPDVLFAVSWRFLISKECFKIPKRGIFVLHDSLLPRYRGFAPTPWVIINGEKETGLSLQRISKKMDSGPLVDQIKVPIRKEETATTLNQKFLTIYPKIILDNLDNILNGTYKKKSQKEKSATYCCKRTPEDGKINFNIAAGEEIARLVRGLVYPYPGAFCFYGEMKVFIWEADQLANPPNFVGRIPGKIWQIQEKYTDVITTDGLLRIKKVSLETDVKKFLRPADVFKSINVRLT